MEALCPLTHNERHVMSNWSGGKGMGEHDTYEKTLFYSVLYVYYTVDVYTHIESFLKNISIEV